MPPEPVARLTRTESEDAGREAAGGAVAPAAPAEAVPAAPAELTLEFALSPDSAEALLRCEAVRGHRQGRLRSRACRIVWHDGAAQDLAQTGLCLAESRGVWRLERQIPQEGQSWLPCAPPPVLAEALLPAALEDLPAPVVPMAAFSGLERRLTLAGGGEEMELCLLQGVLRGVAQEWPAARLRLSGPQGFVLQMARALAASAPIAVPRASLAAEARALIAGQPVPGRRQGAPVLSEALSLDQAMREICGWLTDVLLHWAALAEGAGQAQAVHQMRVACRRLRSALTLFRRAPGGAVLAPVAREVQALAGRLGAARDWDVFLSGSGAELAHVFEGDGRIAAMLLACARERRVAYAALKRELAGDDFRRLALELALLAHHAPWRDGASAEELALLGGRLQGFARASLVRLARKLLAAGPDLAALETEALHDVRKDAKRLRYACEFFAPLFGAKAVRRYLARLADLQEALGAVNDRHVAGLLMARLTGEGGTKAAALEDQAGRLYAAGVVAGFAAHAGMGAREAAARSWRKLRREDPFWL